MKLFLASAIDKTLSLFLPKLSKPTSETKVVFVANAADPYKDKWWVDLDRQAFKKAGFQLSEVDLRETSKDDFAKELDNADILHVCGGMVFYFISLIREKGIDNVIKDYVCNNKIIYTGTSAGSIIAAQSVELYKYDKYDKEEAKFAKNISDFSGFGFVDFLIVPHAGNKESADSHMEMIKHVTEYSSPLILLHDNQAVWVENGNIQFIGPGEFKEFK